jgi:hypothetical protein
MKKNKHNDKLSGLDKWAQIKNRHELFEIDYLEQLNDTEKLMAI